MNLLSEHGGPIKVSNPWAKSFLQRIGFVKWRGSSVAKITIANFEEVRELFHQSHY